MSDYFDPVVYNMDRTRDRRQRFLQDRLSTGSSVIDNVKELISEITSDSVKDDFLDIILENLFKMKRQISTGRFQSCPSFKTSNMERENSYKGASTCISQHPNTEMTFDLKTSNYPYQINLTANRRHLQNDFKTMDCNFEADRQIIAGQFNSRNNLVSNEKPLNMTVNYTSNPTDRMYQAYRTSPVGQANQNWSKISIDTDVWPLSQDGNDPSLGISLAWSHGGPSTDVMSSNSQVEEYYERYPIPELSPHSVSSTNSSLSFTIVQSDNESEPISNSIATDSAIDIINQIRLHRLNDEVLLERQQQVPASDFVYDKSKEMLSWSPRHWNNNSGRNNHQHLVEHQHSGFMNTAIPHHSNRQVPLEQPFLYSHDHSKHPSSTEQNFIEPHRSSNSKEVGEEVFFRRFKADSETGLSKAIPPEPIVKTYEKVGEPVSKILKKLLENTHPHMYRMETMEDQKYILVKLDSLTNANDKKISTHLNSSPSNVNPSSATDLTRHSSYSLQIKGKQQGLPQHPQQEEQQFQHPQQQEHQQQYLQQQQQQQQQHRQPEQQNEVLPQKIVEHQTNQQRLFVSPQLQDPSFEICQQQLQQKYQQQLLDNPQQSQLLENQQQQLHRQCQELMQLQNQQQIDVQRNQQDDATIVQQTAESNLTQPCKKRKKSSSLLNAQGNVKRPLNAFMIWALEERKNFQKTYPDMHHSRISQLLGLKWKEIPAQEKLKYYCLSISSNLPSSAELKAPECQTASLARYYREMKRAERRLGLLQRIRLPQGEESQISDINAATKDASNSICYISDSSDSPNNLT